MTGKCKNDDCVAPIACHLYGGDYSQCKYWLMNNPIDKQKFVKSTGTAKGNSIWTGDPLSMDKLSQISHRTSPILLGILGKAAAGKTSFLGMLYTLLLNGKKFKDFS